MNPTAIYSKSGKGVQEATGKTSLLSRADRSVLGGFDGKLTVTEVADRVGKPFDAKFEALVEQLDKDGFIRQVSAGTPIAPVPPVRPAAGKPAAKPSAALGEDLDFTVFSSPKPKPAAPAGPPVDLAAKARADAERKAKEEEAVSYKARQEAEARAKAEAEARAKAAAQAAAQARAQAEAAARVKAESEARARAEAEAKAKAAEAERALADADAKIKAAQEAAQRIAREAKAKAEADAAAKVQSELSKAREEAERKAREEAERIRKEAEDKARREAEDKARREQDELRKRLDEERKAREEAERRAKEAEERRRKDEEERRAREEAERKAREAEERKRKEEEERRRREEEERRAKEAAERKAREEAERKAKEAEERRRKEEEERRRREEEERRAKEEAERKAKAEAEERRRREEDDRRRKEEEARRARDEEERREREERDRRERAEAEARRAREDEDRRAHEDADRREKEEAKAKEPAKPGGDFADSLLADLDSFDKREEEERKAKEEAERKRKAEKERKAKEEAERSAKEESERRAREERERREKEEAERRSREEEERAAREAEERERSEAEERKRRARESLSARARDSAAEKPAEADDDIGITDEDLDLDEVKRDEAAISKESRRAAREREKERERERERAARPPSDAPAAKFRRPIKWGKPVAIALFALLVGGIGLIHVMPVSTAEYESAASEALGTPVKIGSARISLITGAELKMSNVTVGQAKIATVRAYPEIGSLFGPKKSFSRIDLQDASVPQEALGSVLYGKARTANFEVRRVTAQKLKLTGPVVLPALDADLQVGPEGEARSLTLKGPDSLLARIAPAGSGGDLEFELNANSFTVPVAPDIVLNGFGMKGTANKQGMDVASWTASLYDGVISGTARVAWRDSWSVDGVVTSRGVNAAVFAPALLSEGKVDGTGKFSMTGPDPAKLAAGGHLEGNFTITKGALGSIDVSRALSTGGRQASGRTPFTELTGQGVYDRGAVSLRNITITAGALNAGASADIAASGSLSGRIVADVKTPSQTLRATLTVGGTVKEPQVRN